MFHALDPDRLPLAADLFAALDYHLAVPAILAGNAPGRVYVDDPRRPSAALACTPHRFYLSGDPGVASFNEGLRRHFLEEVYPRALAGGGPPLCGLYHAPGWEGAIAAILAGKDPVVEPRRYLAHTDTAREEHPALPEGYLLRAVDADLLAERAWRNREALCEEMCSERPSVDEFLAKSFGVCITCGDEIAAWCLSEYNTADRCEVGIETVAGHRRKGLGTAAAQALVEMAAAHGVRRVGWHAWAPNVPSIATAHAAGFADVCAYSIFVVWFDEAQNLAVNGNVRLAEGNVAGALEWFERSVGTGVAPAWAYWGAACALARLGQEERAFERLRQAIARGYGDRPALERSPHLAALREGASWGRFLSELEGA